MGAGYVGRVRRPSRLLQNGGAGPGG